MAALKILLLTDFSDLSKVAIHYGLNMYGKLDAEFIIMNIDSSRFASKFQF